MKRPTLGPILCWMMGVSAAASLVAADPPAQAKPAAVRKPTYVAPDDEPTTTAKPDFKPTAKPVDAESTKPEAKPEPKKAEPKKTEPTKPDPPKPDPTKPDPTKPDPKKPVAKKPEKPLTPGGKYRAGDMQRPRPVVIAPPTPSTERQAGLPPSDAIVLFDGTDLSHWVREGRRTDPARDDELKPTWDVKNGYMQCKPRTGSIGTKDAFGDCQLHIEWATPAVVSGSGQGRGNSGILLHGLGEVQVLDSYENDTYPDGQAAAIYNRYPPLVNASRRPGEWQTYDIIVELAKVDEQTKQVVRKARITVLHNGVLVHHVAEVEGRATEFRFALQDHGNTVRYRNIWLRPLKGYDSQ